jgi:hypothetical protein
MGVGAARGMFTLRVLDRALFGQNLVAEYLWIIEL